MKRISKLTLIAVLMLPIMFAFPMIANSSTSWDLSGTYTIDYVCTSGCSGTWTHTMDITSMDLVSGAFSGDGYWNGNPAYTWDVTGTVTNSSFSYTVVYNNINAGYTVNATGSIAPDGTLSGTATGPGQTFTFSSSAGSAAYVDTTAPIVTINSPSDGDAVEGVVDIYGTIVEDWELSHYNISIYPGGVDFMDFSLRLEQQTVYTDSGFNNQMIYQWDTSSYPDGEYMIRLAARDAAGNRYLIPDEPMGGDDSQHVITITKITRHAEITAPDPGEIVWGDVNFSAYLVDNDYDYVDWAVRKGTCAAGTNTVFGNVDGFSDPYDWGMNSEPYTYYFNATANVDSWDSGMYCFIFNPREDSGEAGIRLTRQFYVADGYVSGGGQLIEEDEELKSKDWNKISFGGAIAKSGSNYVGEWQVNFHNVGVEAIDQSKFHSTSIAALNFYPPSSETCNAAMNFTALGEWNGIPGYKIIFRAGDADAPGHFEGDAFDTVRVELYEGSTKVYDTHLSGEFSDESNCVGSSRTGLDNGNITIHWP